MIVAEICRQNKVKLDDDAPKQCIFIDMLTSDDSCTSRKIAKESRKANAALFGRRVKVVNSERQDLDGQDLDKQDIDGQDLNVHYLNGHYLDGQDLNREYIMDKTSMYITSMIPRWT